MMKIERARCRKTHYIFWHAFGYSGVVFGPRSDERMSGSEEEAHRWGWGTLCGEVFWPTWKGSTNISDVTCKTCQRVAKGKLAIDRAQSHRGA